MSISFSLEVFKYLVRRGRLAPAFLVSILALVLGYKNFQGLVKFQRAVHLLER